MRRKTAFIPSDRDLLCWTAPLRSASGVAIWSPIAKIFFLPYSEPFTNKSSDKTFVFELSHVSV